MKKEIEEKLNTYICKEFQFEDFIFTALCIQLYGTKSEFSQKKGFCTYSKYEDMNNFYIIQSALYRGIFWETLRLLDDFIENCEK